MQSIDIGYGAFKAWLIKHAFEHVGTRNRPEECAYARFLSDKGFVEPQVGAMNFSTAQRIAGGLIVRNTQSTPNWLSQFIERFDMAGPRLFTGVTGAEALKYLEEEV